MKKLSNNYNFNKEVLIKKNFKGEEKINFFCSQAGQDIFVISALNGKNNGTFLDIGANHYKNINNTFLLEKIFGWNGISVELDTKYYEDFINERNTILLNEDATKINYEEVLNNNNINNLDYLSIDIDGINSLNVLKNFPFNKFRPKIITFEHDKYRNGDGIQVESRDLIKKLNYFLICSDITDNGNSFEDWYVDNNMIDDVAVFESQNKEWHNIIFF
jgi:hypothetical protein